MANRISIELEIDEKGATRSLNELERDAKKSGEKAGRSLEKGLGVGLGSVARGLAKVGALFGTVLSGATIIKSIQAANEQADAIQRLNTALRANNDFSRQASLDLQAYAAELQNATEFGDELLINQLALAKSFGATNEQAKLVVEAATGLSKEFGISLESATRNAARTLGGFAGELGEVIPQLKQFTAQQLQSGAAIGLLNERFGNSAKNLNTFSFASSQASNAFGDLLEEIGKLITESPEVRIFLQTLTVGFQNGIKQVREFAKTFSIINDILLPLSNFGSTFIQFVIAPIELGANVIGFFLNAVSTLQAGLLAAYGKIAEGAAEFINIFDSDSETAMALKNFGEATEETLLELAGNTKKSFEEILDFPFSESLASKNEEIKAGLMETNAIIAEESEKAKTSIGGLGSKVLSTGEVASEGLLGLKIGFSDATNSINNQAQQTAAIVRNSLGRGIANAVSLLVSNLQKGKNAFADFGKFIFGVFGDLAIQLGQFFIIQGIAVEALKTLGGAAAVAAGAALVALGTLLKGLSGGAGAGAATAGTSGGANDNFAGGTTPSDGGTIATAEPQEEVTTNQITIQGDVFDSEETGLRIFDIISQQSEKNGNVIIGGAFA